MKRGEAAITTLVYVGARFNKAGYNRGRKGWARREMKKGKSGRVVVTDERERERASERERRRESGLVRKGFVIKRSRTRCRNAFVVHRLSARFDLDTWLVARRRILPRLWFLFTLIVRRNAAHSLDWLNWENNSSCRHLVRVERFYSINRGYRKGRGEVRKLTLRAR